MATLDANTAYTFSYSTGFNNLVRNATTPLNASSVFIDSKPSAITLFGNGARQDASKLYIQKLDLPELDASANNSPESILIALLYQAMKLSSNSSTSMIEVSIWKTVFKPTKQGRMKVVILEVKLLAPATYKYELVEINNATDSNIVKYL